MSEPELLHPDFPLTGLDDHMIHQTSDPIRYMWTSDLQAYERCWMTGHDDAGSMIIVVGASFYPNLDAAEAFVVVNIDGIHASVRSFRRLGVDRAEMGVGPIRPTICEGMQHWKFQLEDNSWNVAIDLDTDDITQQVLREPLVRHPVPPGRQAHVTAGFECFVELEGTVCIGDRSVALDRSNCRGSRDRHWGTGRGVGGPALQPDGRLPASGHSGNCFVMFDDYGIWGDRLFFRFGDERRGAGTVKTIHRRLRFEPDTHIFVEGLVDYVLNDSQRVRLHFERLGYQTAYLRCGLYGGDPTGARFQGVYPGSDLTEGSVLDVSTPATEPIWRAWMNTYAASRGTTEP